MTEIIQKIKNNEFLIVFLISIFSFCFCFPNYNWEFFLKSAYQIYDLVIIHPFSQVNVITNNYSGLDNHFYNTSFRLFVPIFCKVFNLNVKEMIYIQFLLQPIFLYSLHKFFLKYGIRRNHSYCFVILFSLTYFTNSFTQLFPYFDSIAFLLLLWVLIIDNYIIKYSLLFLSFFVDERSIIASVSVFIILNHNILEEKNYKYLCKNIITYVFIVMLYAILRFVLGYFFGLKIIQTFQLGEIILFIKNIKYIVTPIVYTYKGIVLCVLFFIIYINISTKKKVLYVALFSVFYISQLLYMYTVEDITRSISYTMFSILLLVCVTYNKVRIKTYFFLVPILVSIFLNNYYIIGNFKSHNFEFMKIYSILHYINS